MKKLLLTLPLFIIAYTYSAQLVFAQQTQTDSYTHYELLDPSSQSFRIIYDVSATTAGATRYWNTLRKGSEHIVDAAIDLYSGKHLEWEIVNGATAKRNGHVNANEDDEYLQIELLRPVPENGETRIRIDKTYEDVNSYYQEGDTIVFDRTLGIRHNMVSLPVGYELISSNYPVQVRIENNRVQVSYISDGVGAVPFKITAKPVEYDKSQSDNAGHPWPDYEPSAQGRDKSKARLNYQATIRAFQDREIVYFLQQPETHSFRLYHDYTEQRPGVDRYLNIVRAGSKASNPSAYVLDTGEVLKVETLKGDEITNKGIDIGEVQNDTEVIVIWFDPVAEGATTRLRIEETYTDPNRYLEYNGELIWDRSFGRNRNRVVLPEGWSLTVNSIPAKISNTIEGKVQLDFVNSRPDVIDVLIKARRRK